MRKIEWYDLLNLICADAAWLETGFHEVLPKLFQEADTDADGLLTR